MTDGANPADRISAAECGFIHLLEEQLRDIAWQTTTLADAVCAAELLTPIDHPSARAAICQVLLNSDSDLEPEQVLITFSRDFVIGRLGEVPWNELEFLEATGFTAGGFERWVMSEKAKIVSMTAKYRTLADAQESSVVEFSIAMTDGKQHCRRVLLGEGKVEETARTLVREIETQSGFAIPFGTTS